MSVGAADLLDPALAHHRDPVAHRERLFLVVGDVDEGDPDLALDALELQLHGLAQLQVEGAQGLVEEQGAGVVDQGPGQGHPLLLATAKLARACARRSRPAARPRALADPALGSRPCRPCAAGAEGDVVGDRHVREQGVVLEDRVHVAPVGRDLGDVLALEADLPRRRLLEAGDHAQGGGLATARRPEQGEELAALDGDVDAVRPRPRHRSASSTSTSSMTASINVAHSRCTSLPSLPMRPDHSSCNSMATGRGRLGRAVFTDP